MIRCSSCGIPLEHRDEPCPNCLSGMAWRPPTYDIPVPPEQPQQEQIKDDKLLYILKNAARIATPHYRNKPTWVFITEVCSVGSTTAYGICESLGIHPEAKAKEI